MKVVYALSHHTYVKKPVRIHAFKYEQPKVQDHYHTVNDIINTIYGARKNGDLPDHQTTFETRVVSGKLELYIKTLEGTMHVRDGDYIIVGVDGELYPCKPEIFNKTYDPIGFN
jgi:hypothetical protein